MKTGAVIVASTSAAAGESEDTTGPDIVRWMRKRSFETGDPLVVPDGELVRAAVLDAVERSVSVVIVTGGTGVAPSDQTPEMVAPLIDTAVPGIPEEIRRRGFAGTPMSLLSRGVAGFSRDSFVITLPGSANGVRDGLSVLSDVLEHMLRLRSGKLGRH